MVVTKNKPGKVMYACNPSTGKEDMDDLMFHTDTVYLVKILD